MKVHGDDRPVPRSWLEATSIQLHIQAGEQPGCDPRHLAIGLGLRLCPNEARHGFVKDGWLMYPHGMCSRERSREIYLALARWVLDGAGLSRVLADDMALELAFPGRETARVAHPSHIMSVFPHFPRQFLALAISRAGGSGVFIVPS